MRAKAAFPRFIQKQQSPEVLELLLQEEMSGAVSTLRVRRVTARLRSSRGPDVHRPPARDAALPESGEGSTHSFPSLLTEETWAEVFPYVKFEESESTKLKYVL